MHEICVCIASLNNQHNNYLNPVTICFPTDISRDCARRKFGQDQGIGDCSHEESLYIESLNNNPLTPLYLSVSQWTELWFVPDDNSAKKTVGGR